jgi:hypothetical protein
MLLKILKWKETMKISNNSLIMAKKRTGEMKMIGMQQFKMMMMFFNLAYSRNNKNKIFLLNL